jgi:hypothetical protein
MQYASDHPRPWSEIRQLLEPAEIEEFETFCARYGVDLETVPEYDVENWYQRWKLTPERTQFLERDG